MAHSCPVCGSYCTCGGDWDDIDIGMLNINCECCNDDDDYWEDDEEWNDQDAKLNPPQGNAAFHTMTTDPNVKQPEEQQEATQEAGEATQGEQATEE